MSLQIPLALLNARMSLKSFERWSAAPMQPLVAAMLSQFSLIAPLVLFLPAMYCISFLQDRQCTWCNTCYCDVQHLFIWILWIWKICLFTALSFALCNRIVAFCWKYSKLVLIIRNTRFKWSLSMEFIVVEINDFYVGLGCQSTKEAIRYQILGAAPSIIHFAGNLKYGELR